MPFNYLPHFNSKIVSVSLVKKPLEKRLTHTRTKDVKDRMYKIILENNFNLK